MWFAWLHVEALGRTYSIGCVCLESTAAKEVTFGSAASCGRHTHTVHRLYWHRLRCGGWLLLCLPAAPGGPCVCGPHGIAYEHASDDLQALLRGCHSQQPPGVANTRQVAQPLG
jgi:hypothetical protein